MRIWTAGILTIFFISQLLPPGSSLVYAEEMSLRLPDLLAELRSANPDLLAARKRWEAAQARIPLSKGLPAPRIGVEWEEIPRGTIKLNKATVMYQLIQSLPFPGKLSLKEKVAIAEAQAASAMFKKTEWEVTAMLKQIYYDLFLLDRRREILEAQRLWLEQAAASARSGYEAGRRPQTEWLRAQGEFMQAENDLNVLTHQREAMAAHLNHLLNRSVHAPAGRPVVEGLEPVPASPSELVERAEQSQPDLLVFKFMAERSEAAWKLSKRERWPDLETMVELRDPAMGPIGPWDLTLALVLPFWFWTKQSYGIKAALYDKESAEAAYQGARNEAARRVHENWHEARAAYDTALLCRDHLIPLARQSVTTALASYQAGRGSFPEVLDALRMWKEREITYEEHRVMLEQRMVMLEQSVGMPLRSEHKEST